MTSGMNSYLTRGSSSGMVASLMMSVRSSMSKTGKQGEWTTGNASNPWRARQDRRAGVGSLQHHAKADALTENGEDGALNGARSIGAPTRRDME